MRLRRRTLSIAAVASSLVLFAGVLPAQATPAVSPWVQSITTAGGTQSTATATWNSTTHALTLKVVTGTLAAGKCVTVYFDWLTTGGHHDARARRNCQSNNSFTGSFTDNDTSNLTGGPQKLGVCYGNDDTQGTCTKADGLTGTIPMDWSPWPAMPPPATSQCTVSWVKRAADGSITKFTDPHSTSPNYIAGAC